VPFLLAERARSECARSMRAVKGSLGHSFLGWVNGVRMWTWAEGLLCSRNAPGFVCLVGWSFWSVWFFLMNFRSNQPDKPDRRDRPDEPAFVGRAQMEINEVAYIWPALVLDPSYARSAILQSLMSCP